MCFSNMTEKVNLLCWFFLNILKNSYSHLKNWFNNRILKIWIQFIYIIINISCQIRLLFLNLCKALIFYENSSEYFGYWLIRIFRSIWICLMEKFSFDVQIRMKTFLQNFHRNQLYLVENNSNLSSVEDIGKIFSFMDLYNR